MNGDRVSEVLDAEVGGKMFRRRSDRRPDDAIDVMRRQPRIGDGVERGLERELQVSLFSTSRELALAHPDDATAISQTIHRSIFLLPVPLP